MLSGENHVIGEELLLANFPTQISHGLPWDCRDGKETQNTNYKGLYTFWNTIFMLEKFGSFFVIL
jgi:hypothetical protein